MANILQRITGRNGQMKVQFGNTSPTGGGTTTANTVAEEVNGISWPAYSVYTVDSADIPLDPAVVPTVTPSGSGAPTVYFPKVDYMLGKVLFYEALSATVDVTLTGHKVANLVTMGDTIDFDITCDVDVADGDAMLDGWKEPMIGLNSWSGTANALWRNLAAGTGSQWWLSSVQNAYAPKVIKFYPSRLGTEYYLGQAIISFGTTVRTNEAVKQALKLTGVGPLTFHAS